jgi:SagB-type dehydrogenase family enzyme
MKRTIIISALLVCFLSIQAQELKVIKLAAPNKTRGAAIMKAFNDRQSVRDYSPESLKPQDLSDLLWAANGINRPDGKRTAPSCQNFQDVEVYVILPEGAYFYDAKEHALNPVSAGDYRNAVAGSDRQAFAGTAPVSIVLVADMTKYRDMSEGSKLMAAVDVGIVCENICLACSGLGLATVPRGSMDYAALKTALKLTDKHLLLINNPVGYPKK